MKDIGVIPYSEKGAVGNNASEDIDRYFLVEPNDIVMNSMNVIIGSVGKSKYKGCLSQVYHVLRIRNKDKSFVDYYDYLFATRQFQRKLVGYGNGILEHRMRIPMSKLKSVEIPQPKRREQLLIATYLDEKTSKTEKLIKLHYTAIERLEEYKQSVITEAVTKGLNPNVKMKDSIINFVKKIPETFYEIRAKYLVSVSSGLSISKAEYVNDGVDYLHYGNIHSNSESCLNLRFTEMPKIPYFYNNKKVSAYLNEGDLVFCDTSEDLQGAGKHIYVKSLNGNSVLSGSHTILAKSKTEFNSAYLSYLFRGTEIKSTIESQVYGIKVYSMSQSILKNTWVILPKNEEQFEIVNFLDKKTEEIDLLIQIKKDKIEKLNEYKKSLIYEAVTGKIEVM